MLSALTERKPGRARHGGTAASLHIAPASRVMTLARCGWTPGWT